MTTASRAPEGSSAPSITVVSGSPGTGKSTLCEALALGHPTGLHLRSDVFYAFPAHPIDPTRRESHHQNETIMAALARCAVAFAEGGYRVFLDGIVGPWFLPIVAGEARERGVGIEYVLLRSDLDETLRRVEARDGAGEEARVRQMHQAFADPGRFASHVIDTTALSGERLVGEFWRRSERGDFALEGARLEG